MSDIDSLLVFIVELTKLRALEKKNVCFNALKTPENVRFQPFLAFKIKNIYRDETR
jgi:hypothetical protein